MRFISKNELFLLDEIVKKNFTSKYKDSVLGLFWTILSPLLMMCVFTIVFSTIFERSIENYPVYFLCGWCAFQFFSSGVSTSMNALKGNKNILKKTPAPKYIFVLGSVLYEFINFLIMLVLLLFIIFITQAPVYWTLSPLTIIPILSLLLMIIGLGLMLSIATVYYSDVLHLWRIFSMLIMYASAIFYPMDRVPQPYHDIFILNPLYWAIEQLRCLIYYGTIPQTLYLFNFIVISLIILVIGIIVFIKYGNKVTMKL